MKPSNPPIILDRNESRVLNEVRPGDHLERFKGSKFELTRGTAVVIGRNTHNYREQYESQYPHIATIDIADASEGISRACIGLVAPENGNILLTTMTKNNDVFIIPGGLLSNISTSEKIVRVLPSQDRTLLPTDAVAIVSRNRPEESIILTPDSDRSLNAFDIKDATSVNIGALLQKQ
jgi:hypothetical protein